MGSKSILKLVSEHYQDLATLPVKCCVMVLDIRDKHEDITVVKA
jgi:hypothetical protein